MPLVTLFGYVCTLNDLFHFGVHLYVNPKLARYLVTSKNSLQITVSFSLNGKMPFLGSSLHTRNV